jgi:hypothetical protein
MKYLTYRKYIAIKASYLKTTEEVLQYLSDILKDGQLKPRVLLNLLQDNGIIAKNDENENVITSAIESSRPLANFCRMSLAIKSALDKREKGESDFKDEILQLQNIS